MSEHSPNPIAEGISTSLHSVPHRMRESIIRYILLGDPMGGFLTAVFSNNFVHAVGSADFINMNILPAYAKFLHYHAPPGSWGSRRDVVSWSADGGCHLERIRFPAEWSRDVAAVVAAVVAERKAEGGE